MPENPAPYGARLALLRLGSCAPPGSTVFSLKSPASFADGSRSGDGVFGGRRLGPAVDEPGPIWLAASAFPALAGHAILFPRHAPRIRPGTPRSRHRGRRRARAAHRRPRHWKDVAGSHAPGTLGGRNEHGPDHELPLRHSGRFAAKCAVRLGVAAAE